MNKKRNKKNQGTTLVEALVGVAIVVMTMMSIYLLLNQAIRLMADSKQRVSAVALATERIESFRNFNYENIPIIDPPNVETIERSGFDFEVETSVVFIDDPENGNVVDEDYKQVKVSVTWEVGEKERDISFVNNFAPAGIVHGMIMVNVFDGDSYSSLGGVLVELDEISGGFSDSKTTDATNGNVLFHGLDTDNKEYQITLSKSGYETVITYDPDDAGVTFDPIQKNVVLVGDTDSALKYFFLRQTSDLTVEAVDEESGDLSGVDVELFGGQKIGNDPDTYDYDDTASAETTDSNGEISYQNSSNVDSKMSPGNYLIASIDGLSKSGYEFIGVANNEYPFTLAPNDTDSLQLVFVDETKHSLLVKLTDSSDGSVVSDATVNVTNSSEGFDETVTSDSLGFAFFHFDSSGDFQELSADDYDIDVEADGYDDYDTTVTVDQFSEEAIALVLEI